MLALSVVIEWKASSLGWCRSCVDLVGPGTSKGTHCRLDIEMLGTLMAPELLARAKMWLSLL